MPSTQKNRKKTITTENAKIGEWAMVSHLGSGGNGEVWECKNERGERCAIKLLKTVEPKKYARFIDEIRALEENSDVKGIIPIKEKYLPSDTNAQLPYYTMPIAESAIRVLKESKVEKIIDAILEVCDTLEILHSRGISHRDIKPSNLLFYESRCSLADFGLVDFPNKADVSVLNEEIGAKWTMAPEMRRESSKADGFKADVYSLAKTLWILITQNQKGFDGQYSVDSVLGLHKVHHDIYFYPIDVLLSKSTDNDPDIRPSITEFKDALLSWKEINKNFDKRVKTQWSEIQIRIFPKALPTRAIWEGLDEIVEILSVVCSYKYLNHLFFPDGGGLDLFSVKHANEQDCIELDFQIFRTIHILKPKRLIFESFGFLPEWNYIRLESDQLESAITKNTEHDADSDYPLDHEDVSELYPGRYDDYSIVEDMPFYLERGYNIPNTARHVRRWFRGTFVIFCKRSVYNLTTSTYDGRHNKMNTDQFRNYIQRSVEKHRTRG